MLVGDITYVHTREGFVYPVGRDGGHLLEKDCWLRHGRDACESNWFKTPRRSGGSELSARQGCDDFSCRVRRSQYTSAEYTVSMSKYGFLASVGRTGVCHVQRRNGYHSTPPAQERTRQPGGYTTPEEK